MPQQLVVVQLLERLESKLFRSFSNFVNIFNDQGEVRVLIPIMGSLHSFLNQLEFLTSRRQNLNLGPKHIVEDIERMFFLELRERLDKEILRELNIREVIKQTSFFFDF